MYGALKTLSEQFQNRLKADARVMSLSRSPETESAECDDVIGVNDGLRDRKKCDRRKTGS